MAEVASQDTFKASCEEHVVLQQEKQDASPMPSPSDAALDQVQIREIRVGLVGVGQVAREIWTPAILKHSKFHLQAVWSRTEESAVRFKAKLAGGSVVSYHGEAGLEEMLAQQEIEAFVVVLPPAVQFSYVQRILAARRHVLSEQPAGLSAPDVLSFVEATTSDSPIWFVSDHLGSESVFQRSNLNLLELGVVLAAEVSSVFVTGRLQSVADTGDQHPFILAGVRQVSMLRQILGRIIEVNCIYSSSNSAGESLVQSAIGDHVLCGTIRFSCGVVCVVNWQISDAQQDERFSFRVWGTSGSLSVELEAGAQGTGLGRKRYALRKSTTSGSSSSGLPHLYAQVAPTTQLSRWVTAICRPDPQPSLSLMATGSAPLSAVVDLMVVNAMLQSKGSPIQIREKQA